MNLNNPDDFDVRKHSIFSILSDASLDDYTAPHGDRNPSIAAIVRTVTKQHSRISLPDPSKRIEINRDVLSWIDLRDKYGAQMPGNSGNDDSAGGDGSDNNSNNVYHTIKSKAGHCISRSWTRRSFLATLVIILPAIQWVRNYSFRNHLAYDLMAGLTLSMVQIPEAMANGYLAGLGAEHGLYVAFFPVLVYVLMGTSHHTAIGTFSITSVMISDVVLRVKEGIYELDVNTGNHTLVGQEFTALEIVTSLCLLCGLIQLLLACLNLGALSLLLSDTIASAFATAAAVQVVTAYFPTLFDVDLPRMRFSVFRLFKEWIEFFSNLYQVNLITAGISLACILFLLLVQQVLQPYLRRKFKIKIPVPSDIIIVVIITLISWLLSLNAKHMVAIVGDVPNGLPSPRLPTVKLFSLLIWDSIMISIVSYVVSASMAKTFANKNRYKINPNQELLAMSVANVFGSFFSCYPSSSSLTRSSVLHRSGAKTQMATLFAAVILLLVILFMKPLIYHLPKCVLSAIILMALKSMFVQTVYVRKVFKYSVMEGITWIITFVSVIICDVDMGLLIAIMFNMLVIMIRLSRPSSGVMGRLSNTELYVNVKHYADALVIRGIKIFHFSCPLIFLNRHAFKEQLYKKLFNISSNDIHVYSSDDMRAKSHINTVIIDCSAIYHMDSAGTDTLTDIMTELARFRIRVLLAGCQRPVLAMLARTDPALLDSDVVYASVHDAVVKCQSPPSQVLTTNAGANGGQSSDV